MFSYICGNQKNKNQYAANVHDGQSILELHEMGKYGKVNAKICPMALSVFSSMKILNSCKKSEKTNEPFLRDTVNRQTDTWIGRSDFIGLSCLAQV